MQQQLEMWTERSKTPCQYVPLLFCFLCWKAECDINGEILSFWHTCLSHLGPAAVNSQPKLRHRRSSSRRSRSWRCTCRQKKGARASRALSTLSSMHCAVSNRWKVRLALCALFSSVCSCCMTDVILTYILKINFYLTCSLIHIFLVAANEEYYQMLMINDSQPPGFDVTSYTIEEINSITSEYTLKNTVSTTALYLILKNKQLNQSYAWMVKTNVINDNKVMEMSKLPISDTCYIANWLAISCYYRKQLLVIFFLWDILWFTVKYCQCFSTLFRSLYHESY